MSSRFHNKYHRHSHHTTPTYDPRYPDAGHDPIASPEAPFLGPFVMSGTLSATSLPALPALTASPAGVFRGYPTAIQAIAVNGLNTGTALQVTGNITGTGSLSLLGNISAANVYFTGNTLAAYNTPVQTTGEFLVVNVNGTTRLVRLWNLQ